MVENDQLKTPNTRALKKSSSSTQNSKTQKSILGFFQVKSSPPQGNASQEPASSPAQRASETQSRASGRTGSIAKGSNTAKSRNGQSSHSPQTLTPVPSNDVLENDEDVVKEESPSAREPKVTRP